jgi:ketol-acid reductoisomerase
VSWLSAADADLAALAELGIVVVGYGNQGRAQALNLRDSRAGRWIRVWARAGTSAERARADGFELLSDEELAAGDLFLCLLPDEAQLDFITRVLNPNRRPSDRPAAIGFAHGFALAFTELGEILRHDPWNEVFLVAPAGPGEEVRAAYVAGHGVPALLAIWHDRSGFARGRAAAIARAIGATRAGVLETTVRDEAVVDLFGEQAVLCGGLSALLAAAFRTLIGAGYAPEMAYFECVQQVRLTAALVHRHGIDGMRKRISRVAQFGDVTRGPRIFDAEEGRVMAEILREIESGSFAAEWLADYSRGMPRLRSGLAERSDAQLESSGREVRRRTFGPDENGAAPERARQSAPTPADPKLP